MQVTEKKGENSLILEVSGQVDTVTAPELQTSILTAFQKTANVYLDLSDVAYMSSAGLRALLIGQKTAASKGGKLIIKGVQDPVMQVFNMSGFSKVLTIE